MRSGHGGALQKRAAAATAAGAAAAGGAASLSAGVACALQVSSRAPTAVRRGSAWRRRGGGGADWPLQVLPGRGPMELPHPRGVVREPMRGLLGVTRWQRWGRGRGGSC